MKSTSAHYFTYTIYKTQIFKLNTTSFHFITVNISTAINDKNNNDRLSVDCQKS